MEDPKGSAFRDFIPAGEDAGGYGDGDGFKDFIPAPEPKVVETHKEEPKKAK